MAITKQQLRNAIIKYKLSSLRTLKVNSHPSINALKQLMKDTQNDILSTSDVLKCLYQYEAPETGPVHELYQSICNNLFVNAAEENKLKGIELLEFCYSKERLDKHADVIVDTINSLNDVAYLRDVSIDILKKLIDQQPWWYGNDSFSHLNILCKYDCLGEIHINSFLYRYHNLNFRKVKNQPSDLENALSFLQKEIREKQLDDDSFTRFLKQNICVLYALGGDEVNIIRIISKIINQAFRIKQHFGEINHSVVETSINELIIDRECFSDDMVDMILAIQSDEEIIAFQLDAKAFLKEKSKRFIISKYIDTLIESGLSLENMVQHITNLQEEKWDLFKFSASYIRKNKIPERYVKSRSENANFAKQWESVKIKEPIEACVDDCLELEKGALDAYRLSAIRRDFIEQYTDEIYIYFLEHINEFIAETRLKLGDPMIKRAEEQTTSIARVLTSTHPACQQPLHDFTHGADTQLEPSAPQHSP